MHVIKRLGEHVGSYQPAQRKVTAQEAAEAGDDSSAVEVEFMKLKGFGAAWNLIKKKKAENSKLQLTTTAQRHLSVLTVLRMDSTPIF